MSDIEVNGHMYRIGRMDVKKQFHVGRRLAPLLSTITGAIANIPKSPAGAVDANGEAKADLSKVNFTKLFEPLAEVIASMSDEDAEYVLDACLEVVKRGQPGNQWAAVSVRGSIMFEDITLQVMTRLTVATIRENMGGFFPGDA